MNDPRPYGAYAPSGLASLAIAGTRRLPHRWATRRIALMLRHLVLRSLKGAPVDVETFGVRMRLHPYNNVCEKRILFTPQYFDPAELAFLASRIREGFTFVDVGSNVGWYALFVAARAGSKARILAVEPQPEVFDRLAYNIRQNPFGTVKAVACAVADKTGELTLFLDPNNRGESSVKIVSSSQTDAIRVPAVTLLDLLAREGFTHVDAMKLDVEGAEDLILDPFFRDAPASLYPSLFIIEDGRDRWQIDLPALLASKGYRPVLQTRMNLVFERGAPPAA
ncbi:FkbM family methyltransferase [Microvirga thermotolerans]|uniref:FkbM family methyltransferase n=1 Tax=Microvirga thermotolerans TaxID=2651334 RepID=A0A5P9JXU7_9HYPH|nr:FkbM family methyltransferase [Microvirga thermotolerans]QFU16951.1 FkbM family methyltransferase [Microvirga thermotolerans]